MARHIIAKIWASSGPSFHSFAKNLHDICDKVIHRSYLSTVVLQVDSMPAKANHYRHHDTFCHEVFIASVI